MNGSVKIFGNFNPDRPLIISGPCSAETREQTLQTCIAIAATGQVDLLRAGIWKPRTRPGQFEGVGEQGLQWLAEAKQSTGLPIAVEVATAKHTLLALEYGVDVVWIGARTTVNPFNVQEIADTLSGTDICVMVKNPMNPDIELWAGAVSRINNSGIPMENIALIHRGFSNFTGSQYRNPPMWHVAIEMRNRFPDTAMICDPSHICGNRETLFEISQKAADLCYNGLIIESHISPDDALSDAAQQITPQVLSEILYNIQWRCDSTDNCEFIQSLERLRSQIDRIDSEVFDLLSRRMSIARQIGFIKKQNNVSILQTRRWTELKDRILTSYQGLNLSEDFIRTLLELIHIESINCQTEVMNKKGTKY